MPYVDSPPMPGGDESALDETLRWLRANPHRLDLGRIGLVLRDGTGLRAPRPDELGSCRQVLDPWTGLIASDVELAGRSLCVTTACHPELDAVAVRISSVGGTSVRIAFRYGSQSWGNAADWTRPRDHLSLVEPLPDGAVVRRCFDGAQTSAYVVRVLAGGADVRLAQPYGMGPYGMAPAYGMAAYRTAGEHEMVISTDGPVLELVVGFGADDPGVPPDAAAVFEASARCWPAFWNRGAALDLAGSTDPRAGELERRVVLSQYLTAIQCAGSLPPQETGLTCNSWRGRVHLEMHWWHAAHFALWGRPELLRRSMGWYRRILPVARHNRQTAALPVYLPGNGGLLAAVALMAAGWDGSGEAPGFPKDGTWTVRHEGFVRSP